MEIKVELNIPADLEIELSSTFLVEPSRQFGVEHSYTEFLELSNCSRKKGLSFLGGSVLFRLSFLVEA